ncbi:MAG: hypothetical protein HYT15_02400 [Candidatus Magasanikbacteria bacterium]|nr:hypothetical protein [Candidatus Magasanikbacteria bacterium]
MFKKVFKAIVASLFFFVFAQSVNAAVIYTVPETGGFNIGAEFSVDIKIDSEAESINASQATINWPVDILEFVEVSKAGSAFNFWVTDPVLSDTKNSLSFIGGTAKGISGGALQILKVKFKALGAGAASIFITDAAVTASDGKGTNILSKIKEASYTIGATTAQPAVPKPATIESAKPVPQPVRVERKPIVSTKLPQKPVVQVPLYPDETHWYNHLGEIVALWEVPADITQVATVLDHSPNTDPKNIEKELFTGKKFGTLEEGVWYIHVRFKNNIGWGSVTHYKILIDTTAPLPFEIGMDTVASDNPSPQLRFETQDSLSGISHAVIFIDDQNLVEVSGMEFTPPPQSPGKHTVLVRVLDKAGNSAEDDLAFEVLPLPAPTVDFITKTVSQGEPLFVSGKTIPNAFVDFRIVDSKNQEKLTGKIASDGVGGWETSIGVTLPVGKYTFIITARDERGAVSFPVDSPVFQVKPKVIISFGVIDLGWLEILIIVILVGMSVTGIGGWYYISTKKTREVYRVIVGRDIDKLSDILSGCLKELEGVQEQHNSFRSTKAAALINKMKDTVAKIKKYIGQEVRRLK